MSTFLFLFTLFVYGAEFRTHSLVANIRFDSTIQSLGGGAQIQYRWHHSSLFAIDATGGVGYLSHLKDQPWNSAQASIFLCIGPSWHVSYSTTTNIYAGAHVLHLHHASVQSWMSTPLANMIGDSAGGVLHRSGFGAKVGFDKILIELPSGNLLSWENEITLQYIPSSSEYNIFGSIMTGIRLGFPSKTER